jgi:hypothetical protein
MRQRLGQTIFLTGGVLGFLFFFFFGLAVMSSVVSGPCLNIK